MQVYVVEPFWIEACFSSQSHAPVILTSHARLACRGVYRHSVYFYTDRSRLHEACDAES